MSFPDFDVTDIVQAEVERIMKTVTAMIEDDATTEVIAALQAKGWTCTPPGEEPDPVRKTVTVLEDHDDRMVVARRVSRYHIGDSAWAHVIIGAYLDPDNAQRALEQEMSE